MGRRASPPDNENVFGSKRINTEHDCSYDFWARAVSLACADVIICRTNAHQKARPPPPPTVPRLRRAAPYRKGQGKDSGVWCHGGTKDDIDSSNNVKGDGERRGDKGGKGGTNDGDDSDRGDVVNRAFVRSSPGSVISALLSKFDAVNDVDVAANASSSSASSAPQPPPPPPRDDDRDDDNGIDGSQLPENAGESQVPEDSQAPVPELMQDTDRDDGSDTPTIAELAAKDVPGDVPAGPARDVPAERADDEADDEAEPAVAVDAAPQPPQHRRRDEQTRQPPGAPQQRQQQPQPQRRRHPPWRAFWPLPLPDAGEWDATGALVPMDEDEDDGDDYSEWMTMEFDLSGSMSFRFIRERQPRGE